MGLTVKHDKQQKKFLKSRDVSWVFADNLEVNFSATFLRTKICMTSLTASFTALTSSSFLYLLF